MGVAKCSSCGGIVGRGAAACPHCGEPTRPAWHKAVFWIVVIFAVIILAGQ